ncbi:NADH:flavin oxidoreductase [Desulfosporosinus sp. HMP52]|uniref:NADH:flavin oxidoreductase n=1 Tax=Desulfosporosinus sp. HMP52 TaxID=1487923 RepID=UPI00068B53B0|nr:NADH:flavin oxidoreductase [Desulfosporosinus sp. HMP52]
MTNLLYSSTSFAGVPLRNRIVYPPITTGFADQEGKVSDRMVEYYRQRASGGVGLIIVEPGVVNPQAKLSKFSAGAWADDQIPGMAKLVQAIKNQGARVFLQLCHAGPKANPRVNGVQPSSASEKPFFFKYPTVRLSQDQILSVVKDFVEAAKRAREAGFDGVELHAAHFYLLSAFLSPLINDRIDVFGGDNKGRAKIVQEIIIAIKKKVGQDFPVIVRYHGYEDSADGLKNRDAVELGEIFRAAGADGLHISAYGVPEPELVGIAALPSSSIPSKDHPKAPFVKHAAYIKQYVNLPIIGVGKIIDLLDAEVSLQEGKCDLVAVGRAILADPQWPNKMAANKKVVRCIGCNNCLNSLAKGALDCRVNRGL